MSYQDTLDRKKSIQAAKKEMEDFSDLLKLHLDYPEIQAIKYGGLAGISQFANYDQKQLHIISKKDEQMEFINRILNAIMKLDEDEVQLMFCKYVQLFNDSKICSLFSMSIRTYIRKTNKALFKLSIILGNDVKL